MHSPWSVFCCSDGNGRTSPSSGQGFEAELCMNKICRPLRPPLTCPSNYGPQVNSQVQNKLNSLLIMIRDILKQGVLLNQSLLLWLCVDSVLYLFSRAYIFFSCKMPGLKIKWSFPCSCRTQLKHHPKSKAICSETSKFSPPWVTDVLMWITGKASLKRHSLFSCLYWNTGTIALAWKSNFILYC